MIKEILSNVAEGTRIPLDECNRCIYNTGAVLKNHIADGVVKCIVVAYALLKNKAIVSTRTRVGNRTFLQSFHIYTNTFIPEHATKLTWRKISNKVAMKTYKSIPYVDFGMPVPKEKEILFTGKILVLADILETSGGSPGKHAKLFPYATQTIPVHSGRVTRDREIVQVNFAIRKCGRGADVYSGGLHIPITALLAPTHELTRYEIKGLLFGTIIYRDKIPEEVRERLVYTLARKAIALNVKQQQPPPF